MARMKEFAPAKINFFLHITGRRPDGYHLLESQFAFADIGDEIEAVSDVPADSFAIKGPESSSLKANSDNLVWRAVQEYRKAGVETGPLSVTLIKKLPVASGIGGGSADAAATLRALQRLNKNALSKEQLKNVALGLGADVPACLEITSVFVKGIGEEIINVPLLKPLACLLVNPRLSLSTQEVFHAFKIGGYAFEEGGAKLGQSVSDFLKYTNSLEKVAIKLCPVIQDVLNSIKKTTGCELARMSGSGATCFGLYDSLEKAKAAASYIGKLHPDWWIKSGWLK